jgi:hypothetical protein
VHAHEFHHVQSIRTEIVGHGRKALFRPLSIEFSAATKIENRQCSSIRLISRSLLIRT